MKRRRYLSAPRAPAAITAPAAGRIVLPKPNALPGTEWFRFAQASERAIA